MSRALTLDEAAAELGCKRRWLEYWLKDHPIDATGNPFYVPVAGRKTFEDTDIARIRASIREEERCRLQFSGVARPGHSIIAEQLAQLATGRTFTAPAAPRTKTLRRVRLPRLKQNTGEVISMVRERS